MKRIHILLTAFLAVFMIAMFTIGILSDQANAGRKRKAALAAAVKTAAVKQPAVVKPKVQLSSVKQPASVPFGQAASAIGDCRVRHAGSAEWSPIAQNITLYSGDAVFVGQNSQLELKLRSGGGLLQILKGTQAELDVLRSGGKLSESIVLSGGKISYKGNGTRIAVSDEAAAGSLSDGEFAWEYRADTSAIVVFEGNMSVSGSKKRVTVKSNQATTVRKGYQPEDPFDLPQAPKDVNVNSY